MSTELKQQLYEAQQRINQTLEQALLRTDSPFQHNTQAMLDGLYQSIHYSVMNGGKRMRPLLVYAAAQTIDSQASQSGLDRCACAIEFIHSYSLVHDDLPAMDDDDLRRGKPTVHKAFDEPTAILAGDALQAQAFELIANADDLTAEQRIELIKCLSSASGPGGMVGGQAIDIAATGLHVDLEHMQAMHSLKTGALIRCAIALGAICARANKQQRQALDHYGRAVGLAFQVHDDILDIEGDTKILGKMSGADIALSKSTYPALLGLDGAKEKASELLATALEALSSFDERAETLRQLARYAVTRKH
ncbi:farnesyl diphosphate synthase/geranylgeranyl diphosphate synthase type II [Sinobacterium caligoides]|uniref:Farnesyl diphosphate synthase/geranylgeranyl diphosphate synthase type II n=1 Tax=Sinobacterium caligoides TaxID=933926 RepID=A0A3N2DPQ3_9GAMM|nr:farnesyl diphosphate synthase [Sinobacterium caligoides]ROS01609.1 farnesyl diphosphate synthase/geranylgeranyl diphosphate synthase type II [Sinobacterium caligoides]